MHLTYAGLKKKIDNMSEFKASEITIFCKITGANAKLRNDIFFASEVNYIHEDNNDNNKAG